MGQFAHFGREYRYSEGEWRRAETPTTPLSNMRKVPRSILALLSAAKRRDSSRYTLADPDRITTSPRFNQGARSQNSKTAAERFHSVRRSD